MILEIVNPAILRADMAKRHLLMAKKERLESEVKGLTSGLNRITESIRSHGGDMQLLFDEDNLAYLLNLAQADLSDVEEQISSLDSSVEFTARTLMPK